MCRSETAGEETQGSHSASVLNVMQDYLMNGLPLAGDFTGDWVGAGDNERHVVSLTRRKRTRPDLTVFGRAA